MIGKRIGMLVVVQRLDKSKVVCLCDCGNKRTMKVGHFNCGKSTSCGCHWRIPAGFDKERIVYGNMMARCHNKNNKRYNDYGGAGITVCNEWIGNPKKFLEDMGKCPDGFQIDRIDNKKGYSKENCRWVSPKENMANRSISAMYIVEGKRFNTSTDAAKSIGVSTATIHAWCKGRKTKSNYYPPKENCWIEFVYGKDCARAGEARSLAA